MQSHSGSDNERGEGLLTRAERDALQLVEAEQAQGVRMGEYSAVVGLLAAALRRLTRESPVVAGDEYVAFLRINDHGGTRPATIHLCDSDHPDAFKVYRHPDCAPMSDDALAEETLRRLKPMVDESTKDWPRPAAGWVVDEAIACLTNCNEELSATGRHSHRIAQAIDGLRALTAAAPKDGRGEAWLPIAEAPCDCTAIIATDGTHVRQTFSANGGFWKGFQSTPTHWMPLPDPPANHGERAS